VRSEILLANEFEEFNEFVANNISSIIKQWPKEVRWPEDRCCA
jgi:hypothetical protein